MWTDGGGCFCQGRGFSEGLLQRVFWAMLPMLWVQFLLKGREELGFP